MEDNPVEVKESDEYVRVGKSQVLYQDQNITIVQPPHYEFATTSRDELMKSIDDHLRYLYDTQKLCDLTIRNGEHEINLHRIVLASHSNKYRDIFADKTSPPASEIVVKDVSNEILANVIKYLYTGEITLTEGNVAQVTAVAFQLGLDSLLEGSKRLLLKFNHENVLKYLMLAQKYSFADLKEQYVSFARRHFDTISNSIDFIKLDEENVCAILSGDEVRRRVPETAVLRAALKWVDGEPESRARSGAVAVLRCVKLQDVPPQDLMDVLEKNNAVADVPEVSFMLYEAYKYHAVSQ